MVLPINISNEDFFKLLKHKIPTSYSTRYTGALSEKIIFKETIEALKRINYFAQEVSDGIWDAELLTLRFRHQEDQQQLAEFCDSFNGIRLQKDLFPHPEIFNHLFFKSVYEVYVQLDKYAEVAFIYDTHHQIIPWMTRNIPYEHIAQLITQVGYQIEHGMNEHREQERNVFDKLIQHAQIFDHLLGAHSSLNVFTIDIRIQDFLRPRSDLLTQVGGLNSPIHDIKLILARFPDLLNGLTKIETHGAKEDLNLHCILILKPSKNFSEKKSIDVLQQQIQNFLGNSYYVSIRNWNEVIRRNYSKIAVGLIKKSQPKNAEAFKYWVLSFFFTLDLYIQPKLPNHLKNHLATNETLDAYPKTVVADKLDLNPKNYISMESSLKELEKANKALSKANQPFLSESERKSVWSTRSLSKTSQAYIEAVKHYYCEIESDPETIQSIIHIEIFIETLVTTRLMAFELSVSGDQEMLTRQVLHGAITRLGKQFILLGESKLENPVIRTKQDFELHENGLIQNSREALQQLTSLQVSKESIRRINSSILNLRRIFTEMSFGYNDKSIKETRINAYRKYKKRLEVATILFQHLMKQDCLIFRLTVELILESEFITQEKLAILWTAFLHHAQRAKPLSWKTGYFGLWHQNEKGHFYADVFIVFDDRAFTDPTSIINVLNRKWVQFIKSKAHLILEMEEKPNFKSCKIQGKSIMQTNEEYSLDRLLIESTNKQRKSDFLQKIIPTFLSHSIFIENTMYTNRSNYHNSDAKLLIKSSIAVASRKNTPSTKSIRQKALKESVDRSEIDDDQ
ncbi:hypothetical protein I9054_001245 [Acinetobacter bereziniae]|uniref:Uncharacterized protein n=2 Tax=Acinetobacter TaxID=469 RepID=A0A8I1ACS5_ACIBZ|nr:hypothetical protein [Acinetobacter bereziniae]QQC84981.1 hypothetical protein I9190_01245 [Acinetobacter bereziniae]UUN98133.1 hypothetical protein I9054_001245 [Acinetobacter bereziniae]